MQKISPLILIFVMLLFSFDAKAGRSMPTHGDQPLNVLGTIVLVDLDAIDSAAQKFTANVYYQFQWQDSRLAHKGESSITKELDEVWHPRIQIINQQKLYTTFAPQVEVFPDGKVIFRQRAWGNFSQQFDLHEFPFDNQDINIEFAAIGYAPGEIELSQHPDLSSVISDELTLADWRVDHWSVDAYIKPAAAGNYELSTLTLNVLLHRDFGYYSTKVILPLLLLVAMSWLVFWIDAEEVNTQISVSITTILTLTAYRFAIANSLPKISYLTRMDALILAATLLTFLALLTVIVMAALTRADKTGIALSLRKWSRVVFPIALVVTATWIRLA